MTLEKRLLARETRRSAAALDALMTEDFLEFGASGRRWTKADVLAVLPGEDAGGDMEASGMTVQALGSEHALVTYELVERGAGAEIRRTLRASIWRRTVGRWQIVFHQGTPVC